MKLNSWTFSSFSFAAILSLLPSAVSEAQLSPHADAPEAVLSRIKAHIEALLDKTQPELFSRHLRSVLALSEEDVLKLELAGADKDARTKELL